MQAGWWEWFRMLTCSLAFGAWVKWEGLKGLSQKSDRGQNLKHPESDLARAGSIDSRGTRPRFHCFVPRTLWSDSKSPSEKLMIFRWNL